MQSHGRKDNRQFSMRKARLKKLKVVHFFFKKKKPHNSELLRKKIMCDGECLLELRQEDADFKAPIWATLGDPEFKRGGD